jgi:hypothetical protein
MQTNHALRERGLFVCTAACEYQTFLFRSAAAAAMFLPRKVLRQQADSAYFATCRRSDSSGAWRIFYFGKNTGRG